MLPCTFTVSPDPPPTQKDKTPANKLIKTGIVMEAFDFPTHVQNMFAKKKAYLSATNKPDPPLLRDMAVPPFEPPFDTGIEEQIQVESSEMMIVDDDDE